MLSRLCIDELFCLVGRNQLRDSEVEQHDPSAGIDNQIRGLEIAVNDEIPVRILNRAQYLLKQPQSPADLQAMFITERCQR